jgi:hypothetical protein
MKPVKSGCDGASLCYAMLACSSTYMVCLGRSASRALRSIRLADFFYASFAQLIRVISVWSLLLVGVMQPSYAVEHTPKLDIGKGGQCVKDPQWMRKNHMHLLKHERDEILRKGIREQNTGLKNCIECHASLKDDSVIAREDSFCVACHKYEAVKIDCFECHSGTRKSAWLRQRGGK